MKLIAATLRDYIVRCNPALLSAAIYPQHSSFSGSLHVNRLRVDVFLKNTIDAHIKLATALPCHGCIEAVFPVELEERQCRKNIRWSWSEAARNWKGVVVLLRVECRS